MLAAIRLNKQNKTIRIVNKEGTLRLVKQSRTIKVVNRRHNLRLQHTGKTGPSGTVEVGSTTTLAPGSLADVTNSGTTTAAILDFFIPKGDKGDTGETGISTFVRSHHGTDPNVARPFALFVEWVGSVAPNNATIEDTWIDTQ